LIITASACQGSCQVGAATEATARELVEIMLRQGGREAATELTELGGEAAVRELLQRAASEGGEELVDRVAGYAACYGPAALKAVERSPSPMIRALDGVSPDLVGPAIRAAAREPEVMARLVVSYGKDGLELAARHPGVGARLAEKLGRDGIRIGRELTTDQAVTLSRFADEIGALPPGDRNQLLDAMGKAPGSALDYLETHPKVLLTAGGVAVVIAAKNNIFGGTVTSTNQSPLPGFIERIISGVENKLAGPIEVIFIIGVAGIFCYVAIQLRSVWKLKADRLERVASNLVAAGCARRPPGHRNDRPRS
jgi:hypothetical protein